MNIHKWSLAIWLSAPLTHLSAQSPPDLVLSGQVGENRVTVGHLIALSADDDNIIEVMTPDGFVLRLKRTHNTSQKGFAFLVKNRYASLGLTSPPDIDHLFFSNNTCSGQAYIDVCDGVGGCFGPGDRMFNHRGQIEKIQNPPDRLLYSVDWNALVSSELVGGFMDASGECVDGKVPIQLDSMLPVTVIDPAAYGINFGSPDDPFVAEPLWQTSTGLQFCSSFESCP